MSTITAAEAREYLAGLALANDHEIEELRRAPVELKLQQIWSLMSAAILHGDDARREAEALSVRERWAALYQATCG
jgi:L-serine deaminase